MHDIERRAFMKGAAIGALAFTGGGAEVLLTPRAARAQGVPLRTLTAAQATILNVRPPYANFYRAALGAVDRASQALNNGRPFAELGEAEQRSFVDNMRQNKVEGWQGPGGPFVYLILRSDAVDVVYGTMEGYASLGIPYMPHIAPTKRW